MNFNPFLFLCGFAVAFSVIVAYIYYKRIFRAIPCALIVAVLLSLLLVSGLLLFLGHYIHTQRALLFNSPVSEIQRIKIASAPLFSLVDHDVIITNTQTIGAIMAAIRSAKICPPEHTSTRWACFLIISTASGCSYAKISLTPEQGAIIFCETSQEGFIYDTVHSDTLGEILEGAAVKNNDK